MTGTNRDSGTSPEGDPVDRETRARFCLAVLRNDRDEILLLRRARDDGFAPGRWGLPGGHIHPGETPDATVARELREEIGDAVQCARLRYVGPVRDTLYGGIYEIHLYLYAYHGGAVRLNDEHEAFAWVSRSAYPHYPVVGGIDEDLVYLGVWRGR